MRKIYFLLITVSILFISFTSKAQVTGIKNIPGDYATLAAAITDLNTNGVGAGGATINIASGYTETAPLGGFLLGSTALNATLTSSNTLVIKKASGTNPVLTAFTGGSSTTSDGVFKIAGADYVTIDGINILENGANSGAALMEWGYAIVNLNAAAPFDGSQNVTIQNCSITLNRLNPNGAFGIYSGHNTATSTTALTITATSDLHSNNKFYGNTVSNVDEGIFILGFAAASPYTLYDQNNDVGGASAATGNTIANMGVNASFNVFGIYLVNQNGGNASYNTFNNALGGAGNITQTIAIYAGGTNSGFTANNNNITVTTASGTAVVAGIYGAVTGNFTGQNNTVTFSDAAGSGTHYGIFTSSATSSNFSGNTIRATTSGALSSTFYFLYNATTGNDITFNNNSFDNINISSSGTCYLIYTSNSTPTINVTNNSITGAFTRTGTSGSTYCVYNFGSPASGTSTLTNNNFSNITTTGTGGIYGLYYFTASGHSHVVTGNTVSNWSTNGAGQFYGMYIASGATNTVANNTVQNLSTLYTFTVYGLYATAGSTGTGSINNNLVNNVSNAGSTLYGLYVAGGFNGNVYKNKVYNITSNTTAGIAYGMYTGGGTTLNIYNNYIGHIAAPASTGNPGVAGLYISSGTTVNAYYNTIYLTGSGGTNFNSAGIYASATPTTVNLRNNLVSNNSVSNGTGRAASFRKSSTSLVNYAATSNNNMWYSGGNANSAIFYDGTNTDATLSAFQARVTPRDAASVTELNTPFISLVGSSPSYLHISTSTPTVVEGTAASIASVTDDYDGDARNATTPDIGADEFAGIALTACAGTPTPGTISGGPAISCSAATNTLTLSGYSVNSGITVQWQSSATSGGPYVPLAGANAINYSTGALAPGTYYFVATVTCANGGASANSAQYTLVVNATPTITITPSAPTVCSGSLGTSITASGANTYVWTPASGLSTTSGATVIANPASTTTYTVTGTSAAGCVNTGTVTVTVTGPPYVAVSPTTTTMCATGVTPLVASGAVAGTANLYTFSAGSGATLDPMTGATTVISINDDDTPNASPLNIGFTFPYEGTNYTQYSVSPDGWILLGGATASSQFTNAVTSTINIPKIYPYWDDVATGTNGYVKTVVTGTAPNRIFKVEWYVTIPRNTGGAANSTFQAWLYESSGRIEYRYGTMTSGSMSASVGITGVTATNFQSVTISTNTSSNTVANDANAGQPTSGTIYTLLPPQPAYSWTPTLGLFTDAGASTPYTGTSLGTVYAKPTASTTYTVTGTSTAGCTSFATTTVLVDQVPSPVISPVGPTICPGTVQPLTVTSNSTAALASGSSGAITVAIPDNNAAGATNAITISGIPVGAVISNIAVTVNATHPNDGDLILNLKGPNNNVLNLVNQKGGNGSNFVNTTLASYAGLTAVPALGAPYYSKMYSPDGTVGVGPTGYTSNVINYTGLFSVPNGTWTLALQDAAAGNTGTLTGWSITIFYLKPDNTTWSPTATLYTDAAGTIAYTGTNLATVYAKPSVTTVYTVNASTPGGCSGTGTVTVNVNQPPAVSGQPVGLSLCPGNTATFTVTATGAGLTYQWMKNGSPIANGGNISGATTTTLTITNITVADAGNYTVVVSGTCSPSATSNIAVLAVGAPPIISSQPQSQIACLAGTVSFTVSSPGTNTYVWRKNGTPLVNGGNISGATTATLTISNISATDAGNYDVIVTNSCGQSSTSTAAVLTFSTADRWLGTANSDWNNPLNWCSGVPTSTTDVVIPVGTIYPAIVTATNDVRNLQVDAGATLTISSSGWLSIYGSTLTLNGTFNPAAGTIAFRNTANLNVPAMTIANVVMNGTGGITMTGNLTIGTALTLTNGNITLGNNNLVMTGGTVGSAASHVVTNGTGVVTMTVNVPTVVFPVGPTAASYNPVWVANGQALSYSIRVATGVPGTLANGARAINRTWTVTPSGAPANPVSLNFGYADVDANASCTPTANMEIGSLTGTTWTIVTPAGGVLPAGTATQRTAFTTSRSFGTMVVANVGGVLTPTGTPNLDADIYSVKLMPNLVNEQSTLRVMSRRSMNVDWTVTDIQGRIVMKFSHGVMAGQNDMTLRLGHLATGSYQVVGYTDKGATNVIKFVKM
jgi:subtilisin-like proprotein convertase family protein